MFCTELDSACRVYFKEDVCPCQEVIRLIISFLENQKNIFLSAFLVVLSGWDYYCYLDEQNGIFKNGEY